MGCKRVALVFQGTVINDARVRREIESISKFSEIDVFSSDYNASDIEVFNNSPNVRILPYHLNDSWLNRNLLFYKKFSKLLDLIDPMQYDCLICIDYPLLKIGVELKKKNPSLKLIYDSHEIYIETINQFFPQVGIKSIYGIPLRIINKLYHKGVEKKLVTKVDYCITVCDSLKSYFEENWKVEVLVLRNCPDLKQLDKLKLEDNPYTTKYNCGFSDKILLYQGDINPGRGLFHLIKAMAFLPSTFKLFIIGSGMSKNELVKLAGSLNLYNVIFIDRLPYDALFGFTKYAHLGISLIEPINLSKEYSLPNKLFEYMYCGIPFLSSDLPEPNNLLKFVDAGYICPDFGVETIKNCIEHVFLNMEVYELKSKVAKTAINETLNWEVEFESVIRKL